MQLWLAGELHCKLFTGALQVKLETQQWGGTARRVTALGDHGWQMPGRARYHWHCQSYSITFGPASCWDTITITLHCTGLWQRGSEATHWSASCAFQSQCLLWRRGDTDPVHTLPMCTYSQTYLSPRCLFQKNVHRPYIRWTSSPTNNTHFFACDDHGHTAQHRQCNHDVANLYPDNVPCSVKDLRPVEDRAEFPFCSSMCEMGSWGDE